MTHSPYCPQNGVITVVLVTVCCVLSQSLPPLHVHPSASSLIVQNYSRVARHNHQPTGRVVDACGGTYGNSITSLTSPNYPANYPPNLHCVYVLRSPVRCAVDFHVQFVDFDLPATVGCAGDRLQIDGGAALCGRVIGGRKYRTDDGVLRIELHTDGNVESSGFELRVLRLPCANGTETTTPATAGRMKRVLNVDGENVVRPIYVRPLPWRSDSDANAGGKTTASTTAEPRPQLDAANLTNSRQYLPPSFAPSPGGQGGGYQPNQPGSCWNTNNGWIPPPYPPPSSYPGYNPAPSGYYPPGGWQQPAVGPAPTPAYVPSYPTYNPTNWQPMQPSYPSYPSYPATQPGIVPIDANSPGNTQCIPFCLPPSSSDPPGSVSPPQPSTIPRLEHQAQIYPNTLPRCCSRTFSQRRFYLASDDFPSTIPLTSAPNRDCVYHIERASASVCRLRIEFRHFNVGAFDARLGGCQPTGSYVDIDGRRLCGCNTGLRYVSQWGLGAKVIRVRQLAAAAAMPGVHGFWLDVVQEECPSRIAEPSPAIARRSDGPARALLEQQRLHSAVTHTNSSSMTTYYYYGDIPAASEPNRVTESKEAFAKRTEAPASSQFFVLDALQPSRDRCSFGYGNYLRLVADPLWQLRPRCGI